MTAINHVVVNTLKYFCFLNANSFSYSFVHYVVYLFRAIYFQKLLQIYFMIVFIDMVYYKMIVRSMTVLSWMLCIFRISFEYLNILRPLKYSSERNPKFVRVLPFNIFKQAPHFCLWSPDFLFVSILFYCLSSVLPIN